MAVTTISIIRFFFVRYRRQFNGNILDKYLIVVYCAKYENRLQFCRRLYIVLFRALYELRGLPFFKFLFFSKEPYTIIRRPSTTELI